MKRILFVILIGWSISGFTQNSKNDIYDNCISFIKNNKTTKDFVFEQLGSDSIVIMVSGEIIPFSHSPVIEDVLRKDYIADYSMFKMLKESDMAIEKRINDSLICVDAQFNKMYSRHINPDLIALSDSGKPKLVLYFSEIEHQNVFLELVPYTSPVNLNERKNNFLQGRVLTFLLLLNDEGEVIKSYHGIIHYD